MRRGGGDAVTRLPDYERFLNAPLDCLRKQRPAKQAGRDGRKDGNACDDDGQACRGWRRGRRHDIVYLAWSSRVMMGCDDAAAAVGSTHSHAHKGRVTILL